MAYPRGREKASGASMIRFTLDHQEREYPDDTATLIAEKASLLVRGIYTRGRFTSEDYDFIRYLCREYIREQEVLKDMAESYAKEETE